MMALTVAGKRWRVSRFKVGIATALVWVAMLFAASYLVYLGLDTHKKADTRMREELASYAHLIAEHDRFGFTVADVILRDMLDFLTEEDFVGEMSKARREQVLEYLKRHRQRLPGIASFTLIGTDGIRRIGVVGKDGTDLSDRGYFIACKEGKESFISNVEDGRASGKPGIHVARRVTTAAGHFGGVIALNLSAADVFFSFYQDLALGPEYSTSLRDPDRVLISYPKVVLGAGNVPKSDPLRKVLMGQPQRGLLEEKDAVDGDLRLTAYERLEGTNLYAAVTIKSPRQVAEATTLLWWAVFAAGMCVLGAVAVTMAIQQNQALTKARDDADRAASERKALIRKINSALEDERRDIAVEIHDVLNAMLIRVKLDAQGIIALAAKATPDAVIDDIVAKANSIKQHANELYDQSRRIVRRLRPETLDVLGLEQAVDEMIKGYSDSHPSCHFGFSASRNLGELDAGVAIAAYRVVQEALSNIIKHANAKTANVTLALDVAKGELQIVVQDDGDGFDMGSATPGIGVIGMRERMTVLNGTLEIVSAPHEGTRIDARIPVKEGAPAV